MAADDWDKIDTALSMVSTTLLTVDMLQTLEAADNDGFYETSYVYGRHPKRETILLVHGAMILGSNIAFYFAPKEWRRYLQGAFIGVSFNAVMNNFAVGVNINLN